MSLGLLLGIAMFVGPAIGSGVQAGKSQCNIQKNTIELQKKTAEMKTQFQDLLKNAIIQTNEINKFFDDTYSEIDRLNSELNVHKKEYRDNMRNIQIAGIFLVSFVFLLLVLKEFDLMQPIWEILVWPFKQILNLFKTS
jgi:peptidoglycan hydrolase CwlO-like protein